MCSNVINANKSDYLHNNTYCSSTILNHIERFFTKCLYFVHMDHETFKDLETNQYKQKPVDNFNIEQNLPCWSIQNLFDDMWINLFNSSIGHSSNTLILMPFSVSFLVAIKFVCFKYINLKCSEMINIIVPKDSIFVLFY
jgi:hypothetical protein